MLTGLFVAEWFKSDELDGLMRKGLPALALCIVGVALLAAVPVATFRICTLLAKWKSSWDLSAVLAAVEPWTRLRQPVLIGPAVTVVLAWLAVYRARKNGPKSVAFAYCICAAMVAWISVIAVLWPLYDRSSARYFARALPADVAKPERFFTWPSARWSFQLYTGWDNPERFGDTEQARLQKWLLGGREAYGLINDTKDFGHKVSAAVADARHRPGRCARHARGCVACARGNRRRTNREIKIR